MLPPGYTAVHNSRLPWTVLFNLFCFCFVCLFCSVYFCVFLCCCCCCCFFFFLLYFYCIFLLYNYDLVKKKKKKKKKKRIIKRNALRVSKHVTESIRNIARGVGIN